MQTLADDMLEAALVELASAPGETLPITHSGSAPSNQSPSVQFPAEWDAEKMRPKPRYCEFMISMDPHGEPRHQCPNDPVILMELDIGVSPTYRWACEAHANERVVPLKIMIIRKFKGEGMNQPAQPIQGPPALKPPLPDLRIPVHADSCRVGIRLTVHAIKGVFPSPQEIEHILARGAANVTLREFPITSVLSGACERRRIYATKALEMLLHHSCQDALTISIPDMDKIVEKAWHIAGAMDRADMTAQQLDTLGT